MQAIPRSCDVVRFHPRVAAGFMVKVLVGGRLLVTKATDVSMDGLLIRAAVGSPGERLVVWIPLPGDREVATEATIVRCHDDGWVALKLDDLDWDDLLAMARFVHPRL